MLSGQQHAPAGEVLHGWLPEELAEALGKRRARQSDLLRQFVHCPGVSRVLVHQRERATDKPIAQAGQPARLLLRQRLDILPHRLDKQQLGELGKDRRTPRARRAALGDREPHRALHPRCDSAVLDAHPQHTREAGKKRLAEARIAGEISTHEPGGLAAASRTQRGDLARAQEIVERLCGQLDRAACAHARARENMAVTVWKHDEVAGLQLDRRAVHQSGHATAPADQVIGDDVLCSGHVQIADQPGRWRQVRPPCAKLGIQEHGAGEPYGVQYIRECVHGLVYALALRDDRRPHGREG
jgi:hypothetical protein